MTKTPDARTAEQNAAEFAALTKQGKDVRLALLVACSVKRGAGQGARLHRNHDEVAKVSAQVFAKLAGTSADRILRHLTAWDKFAALAKLPASADLSPGHAVTLTISEKQAAIFAADVTLGTSTQTVIAQNPTAMAEAIRANPKVAAVAASALIGTVEATHIAATVMSDPDKVEAILADPDIDNSVRVAQMHKELGHPKPKGRPPVPTGKGTPTATSLTLTLGMLEMRVEKLSQAWGPMVAREADADVLDVMVDGQTNREAHIDHVRTVFRNEVIGMRAMGMTDPEIRGVFADAHADAPSSMTLSDDDLVALLDG